MVKTELMDTELREIVWLEFNFLWCTGYYPYRYRKEPDLLIHKETNNFRPHRLRTIFLFYIEVNLHNKHMGKLTMKTKKKLHSLAL